MASSHGGSVPAWWGPRGFGERVRSPSRPEQTPCRRGPGQRDGVAAALSCVWWSLRVPGANACEKQIYFCLRFIFFTLHGGRQRISSSMES